MPTPPFWLATTMTRVASGRASGGRSPGALTGQQHVLGRLRERGGLVAVRVGQRRRHVAEVPGARERVDARRCPPLFHVKHRLVVRGRLRLWRSRGFLWMVRSSGGFARWKTPREPSLGKVEPPSRATPSRPPAPPVKVVTLAAPDRHGPPGRRLLWTPPSGPASSTIPASRSAAAQHRRPPRLLARPSYPSWRPAHPPGATSGIAHPSSRSSGASARAVTTSNRRRRAAPRRGPGHAHVARAQCSATASARNVVRRSSGSTRVRPGPAGRSPAPVPAGPRPTRGPPRGALRHSSGAPGS